MEIKVINKELDMAKKWRVWVDIGNNELVMFKFQDEPQDEEIIIATKNYISSSTLTKEAIDLQISSTIDKLAQLEEEKKAAPAQEDVTPEKIDITITAPK